MNNKGKITTGICAGILVLAVLITAAVLLIRSLGASEKNGPEREAGAENMVRPESPRTAEKWQEGVIQYEGRAYQYNSGIKTYLFMGIDREGENTEAEDENSGGQSDAMFLLVTDSRKKTVSVIAINRNTMAEVEVYDVDGDYADTRELQICLQHAYGDGQKLSGQRSAEAVSRLFDNIPIAGYLSLNMDGIGPLNDAVGGVTVEVMDDLENSGLDVHLKKGETVTLNGNEAYVYLRSRDMETFDSSGRRLERQQQYLLGLLSAISGAAKGERPVSEILEAVDRYLVSSMDLVKLAGDLSEYEFDPSRMYSVPGETVMGDRLEEYHVDQEAFYKMILEIFYEPAEEAGQ